MRGQDITVEHQAGQQHARSEAPMLPELPDRPTVRRGPDHRYTLDFQAAYTDTYRFVIDL